MEFQGIDHTIERDELKEGKANIEWSSGRGYNEQEMECEEQDIWRGTNKAATTMIKNTGKEEQEWTFFGGVVERGKWQAGNR